MYLMVKEKSSSCNDMNLSIWLLVFILVVKINHVDTLSRCRESLSTVVNVKSCPKNKAEWESRAKKKGCSKVTQRCVGPEDFLYHCLINEYINMTIEVCAPLATILGHKCAEFNTVGAVVQDNVYAKCSDSDPPCPFRYNSTDLYKYQRCYNYIKSTNNTYTLPSFPDDTRDQNMCSCDENIWLAVSIVFNILFVISCGFGGVLFYKYRNLRSRTLIQNLEEIPLISKEKDVPLILKRKGGSKFDQEVVQENSWVYSIYFGDKYYGTAFMDPKSPKDITSLGNHEVIGALVKKNGEVIEFGDKARNIFTDNEPDCSDYTFLDHDELDIVYWNDNLPKLDSVRVFEVYQNILGFLVKKLYKEIAAGHSYQIEEGTSCCESGSCMLCNMHYVITIPYHWKGIVTYLREALERTMRDLHINVRKWMLHIKLREVAISPYLNEVKASVICLNFNVDNFPFQRKSTYVNLHVGSKYCNITFLKVRKSSNPDTIVGRPYRRKWRRTPENLFEELLEHIFTPNIFIEWKKKYEREYISLLCLLEDRKNKMRENMDDKEKYEFPLSSNLFKPFVEDKSKLTLLRDEVTKQGGEMEMKDGVCKLIFKWSLLKTFFKHVKESIQEIIWDHKEEFETNGVRLVIMTGSYSQMKLFLHEAEKVWFKDLIPPVTVVTPVHFGSTYTMGAAYFFKTYPKWIFHDLINN